MSKKTKDMVYKSKELEVNELNLGEQIDPRSIDEIVKTTDSINLIKNSVDVNAARPDEAIRDAKKAILKNYEVATRKIVSSYNTVVSAARHVDESYFAVQVLITRYEEFKDYDKIYKVITVFADEVMDSLAQGHGVWFDNSLVLSVADHVGRMMVVAEQTTSFQKTIGVKAWEEIFQESLNKGVLESPDILIIEALIKCLVSNVENGYYVHFGRVLIARIRVENPDLMALYSLDTIKGLNARYNGMKAETAHKNKVKKIKKTNYEVGPESWLTPEEEPDYVAFEAIKQEEAKANAELKRQNLELFDNDQT